MRIGTTLPLSATRGTSSAIAPNRGSRPARKSLSARMPGSDGFASGSTTSAAEAIRDAVMAAASTMSRRRPAEGREQAGRLERDFT